MAMTDDWSGTFKAEKRLCGVVGDIDMTANGVTGRGGDGRKDTVQSSKGDRRGAVVRRLQSKACEVALVVFSQVEVGSEAAPLLTEGAGPVQAAMAKYSVFLPLNKIPIPRRPRMPKVG